MQIGATTPIPVGQVFLGMVSDTPIGRVQMDDTGAPVGIVATALLQTEAGTSAVFDDPVLPSWDGIKSLYRTGSLE